MSTTDTKRTLEQATEDAHAFVKLLPGCIRMWEIAGSVRRRKPEVGDIEHVIIPVGTKLHDRLDELVGTDLFPGDGTVTKAVYPNGTHRWGDKYRGVMFRGFRHELFLADEQNWGCILAIRTGPAAMSERLVTALHRTRLRQSESYLRYQDGTIYPCPTERAFFDACKVDYLEPWEREHGEAKD